MNAAIGAASFQVEAGGGTAALSGGAWTSFSGATTLLASVPIPVGRRINYFIAEVDRGGSSTILVDLIRRSGGTEVTLKTISISSGSGWTSTRSSFVGADIEDGYVYEVRVTCTAASNKLGAVRFELTNAL
jgi:hypothetical protein